MADVSMLKMKILVAGQSGTIEGACCASCFSPELAAANRQRCSTKKRSGKAEVPLQLRLADDKKIGRNEQPKIAGPVRCPAPLAASVLHRRAIYASSRVIGEANEQGFSRRTSSWCHEDVRIQSIRCSDAGVLGGASDRMTLEEAVR